MAVPTTHDPAYPNEIRCGCLTCQSEFSMKLTKAGYYEGVCVCGQRWQTPKNPHNPAIRLPLFDPKRG